jgi:hypothetical protein
LWEYALTVELLRSRLDPVLARWNALERGLYVKAAKIVSADEAIQWHRARMEEIGKLAATFSALANGELQASWGPLGQAGNPKDILRVCDLFVECAEACLQWEEDVRFAIMPSDFDEVRELLSGIAGRMLSQLERIPAELGALLEVKNPSGHHRISLVFDLPDGLAERFSSALKRVVKNLTII